MQNKPIFDKNYFSLLLCSLLTLYTSGGVFQHFLSQQSNNNTLLLPSVCNSFSSTQNFSNSSLALDTSQTDMSAETILIYVVSAVLPLCPFLPMASTTGGILPQFSSDAMVLIKPIIAETFFTHMIGQASAFASTEALQYLIVYPSQMFYDACGLKSKEECENKFGNKHEKITISQICNNAVQDNKGLLADSTHSLPQLAAVMLGASIVMFFYCYRQVMTANYKLSASKLICKTKSTKIIVLFALLVLVALCLTYLAVFQSHAWTDIMYSFFSGVFLQAIFVYILKFNKNKKITQTSCAVDADDKNFDAADVAAADECAIPLQQLHRQNLSMPIYKDNV